MKVLIDPISRFWSHVDTSGGPAACWPWKLSCVQGYGQFKHNGKYRRAHTVALEFHTGVVDCRDTLHSCDNPPCCNPAHLFKGTNQDNVADKVAKGRQCRGTSHGRAVLGEQQVLSIRASTESTRKVAKKFGVSQTLVRKIKNNTVWSHVA